MSVAVMQIGKVYVLVAQRLVPVPVVMRFEDRTVMAVLVMRIVDMTVLMLQRLVRMLMIMSLGQV